MHAHVNDARVGDRRDMPRDPEPTRARLIDAGRRLFALGGINTTPLSSIVTEAGQKNTSALHYHFGGRYGLLMAIVDVHNDPIEARRKAMLDRLSEAGDTTLADVVRTMVEPQAEQLATESGRQFTTIVSQFEDLFDAWDQPDADTPPQALRALSWIVELISHDVPIDVRRERATRFLAMVSEALGARARQIDRGISHRLDHDTFIDNLVAMSVGALDAPSREL